jgi:hypothetical protein
MNDLLAHYRRQDKAMRVSGILVLLLLIGVVVMPDRDADGIEAPSSEVASQVALFEPARSQAADEWVQDVRSTVRDYN